MASSFKVIIVGAGLAGSLLANGLIHNNINVAVYERLPEDSKREGYQIRLGAPALQGFRACLTAEQITLLVQKFGRANGTKSGAPICYDQHFNELLDLAKFPSYSKSAPINRQVLRSALSGPVSAAGKLTYGKGFERYEIIDAGSIEERVRVWFETGDFDDCDLLIGADGNHSKINKQLGVDNIHQIGSHMNAVAKGDLPTARYLAMTPQLSQSPVISFADNMSLYFCAYLPDKYDETGTAKVAEIDTSLSSSMFGVHVPVDRCPDDIVEKTTAEKWDFISSAFRSWGKEYHEIIDLVKGSDIYMYKARASTRPAANWRQKVQRDGIPEIANPRVWLLGDAIHPMLPTRGMGGNQAMRDTATLLPLLIELSKSSREGRPCTTDEVAQACKKYEDEMIPRAFGWVQKSGGINPIPIDADTWIGSILFFLAAQATRLAFLWHRVSSLVVATEKIDDAPELQT